MTVDYKEYLSKKNAFLEKHGWDFRVDTSSMDEYGRYHKEYVCSDNAIWYEVMSPEYVKEEVEIKKTKMLVEVKMFRTEFYSSDDAKSLYYYEKY